jgi:hypothetical protein
LLSFGLNASLFAIATIVPAFVALFLIIRLKGLNVTYLSAATIGVLLYFFQDVLNDAGLLDVNQGFNGGSYELELVGIFVFGLVLVYALERAGSKNGTKFPPLLVPVMVALAIQLHGIGEGLEFGQFASTTLTNNLIYAIGGYGSGVAYIVHKFLECVIIGAAYLAYTPLAARRVNRDILILGAVAIIPGIIGDVLGNFVTVEGTYFFALGAGASIYVFARMGRHAFSGNDRDGYVMLALLIGFFLMFFAALLHAYAPAGSP